MSDTVKLTFTAAGCQRIGYRFQVDHTKFSMDDFLKWFTLKEGMPTDRGVVFATACSTRNAEDDYHAHFEWRSSKKDITITVSFVRGMKSPDPDEKEPLADNVMAWVGKFFLNKTAAAHLHGSFEYSLKNWESFFPLPIEVPLSEKDRARRAEIDGYAMKLEKGPHSADRAWVSVQGESLWVDVAGARRVNFDDFDVHSELAAFSRVTRQFVSVR